MTILKTYTLSKFQVCNWVLLLVVSTLYIRSPVCSSCIIESLYPLANISSSLSAVHPALHPEACFLPTPLPQPLATTIQLSASMSSSISCCCLVAKLCRTLVTPMDYSPPGSSGHGISQARILERVAISYSRRSSWCSDWTCVSFIGRWILYHWATREALNYFKVHL